MTNGSVIQKTNVRTEILGGEKFPLKNRSLHLSIEVREDELLACILDKHSNNYIAFCRSSLINNDNTLSSVLHHDFFKSSFADVSVAFTSNSAILTPAAFYNSERLSEYLSLSQLEKAKETPCSDYIKTLESYNLYTVNAERLSAVRDFYPNAAIRHNSSVFIEHLLIQNKGVAEDKVHIAILENYMDVAVLQKGRLSLQNRFYYQNSNDFLYYLLWVYEQLQLDSFKTACLFYGDVTAEIKNAAMRYIATVATGAMLGRQRFASALEPISSNRYHSLFAQYSSI